MYLQAHMDALRIQLENWPCRSNSWLHFIVNILLLTGIWRGKEHSGNDIHNSQGHGLKLGA